MCEIGENLKEVLSFLVVFGFFASGLWAYAWMEHRDQRK